MVVIHHLSNSHSHVALWLMEELGQDYEIVHHQRDPQSGRSPQTLRAVHPAAKAPTIEDNGGIMIESTGVLLYLLETYGEGRLRPAPGTPEAMLFYQWLTYVEGSAKPPLSQLLRLRRTGPEEPRRIAAEAAAAIPLGLIERTLDGQETIVPGMFTVADIQLTFLEELMDGLGRVAEWPNMHAHLLRMRARDGYRRAEAKGGAVDLYGLFNRI